VGRFCELLDVFADCWSGGIMDIIEHGLGYEIGCEFKGWGIVFLLDL
jgi:hypothetical protein